ncbi:branched-chain amino acid transport system substrate-binding protein [Spinactinospora alkalitolerans]|uniref:Branched-chain amino acid transport system substrate-binding protein n=1 Tax=Spinactinospora alkalitolerans TaxID=687207 RepID=A0A852TU11_9ACTN|nr:substrate-binding domain-containing protein [Spinactinospora alkalitolerans]NYE45614.1 branched-chain amino acid transport system substrate-binding protein [Spinactinospora alkalitolerans]
MRRLRHAIALCTGILVLAASGCGSPQSAADGSDGSDGPIKVGLVYSASGPLATYGLQYYEGFQAGLDHATGGTGEVDGRAIEVSVADGAGDPNKAVAAAKDLIGKGSTIIAGSTSSGVAVQVAPVAEQNDVLFVSGPAATDEITGINDHTFRSGRQTYQDILTARTFLEETEGGEVVVLAQQNAFGQDNVAAVTEVLEAEGAEVGEVLAPPDSTDLTPFADQVRQADPDLLFVAWAGETASAMWQALDQQGVLDETKVTTGLDIRASYPVFGATGGRIDFLSHYFAGASDTAAAEAMAEGVAELGGEVDLFTPDGFTAAQMIVRAAQAGDATEDRIAALEGWTFDGVKGEITVRAEDHALLQPMYQVRLNGSGTDAEPELLAEVPAGDVEPPVSEAS